MRSSHPFADAGGGFGSVGHWHRTFSFYPWECARERGPAPGSRLEGEPVGGRSVSRCFIFLLISDKMFPALGFGAQLPPDWKVSEAGCFRSAEVGLMCVTSPRSALERPGAGAQLPCLL